MGDTQGFGLDERRDMSIGKKIASRRKELGLTQEMLAEKLSLSAQAVSRWENEWNLPDMDNLGRIAEILGMSVSNLIGEDRMSYEWEIRDQLFSEEHMFTRLKTIAEIKGLTETYRALYYIRSKHAGQFRKKMMFSDAHVPYIIHPLMMACHAQSMGLSDDTLLSVILLHDVCEDCGVEPADLPFSEPVRRSVELLTKKEDPGLSKEERNKVYYSGIAADPVASMAKIIDRCNNVSTMAQAFSDEKLNEYIEETETYVLPLLKTVKQNYLEYNNAVFLIKYHMLSVLESLKNMMMRDR